MSSLLIKYLLWSGAGIMLFYLLERLLLSRSTLFLVRRIYYLTAIVLSLILPAMALFLPLQAFIQTQEALPTFTITYDLPAVFAPQNASEVSFPWINLLILLWAAGCLFYMLRLVGAFVRLRQITKKAVRTEEPSPGILLHIVSEKVSPFTYGGRHIVMASDLYDSDLEGNALRHEMAHIREKHFIDLYLSLILRAIQWWNPFAWGLSTLQNSTLEYLADASVLKAGVQRRQYQMHLLQSSIRSSADLLMLSFSMNHLKDRVTMMNRKNNTRKSAGLWYALITLPVAGLLLLGSQLLAITPASAASLSAPVTDNPPVEEKDEPVESYLEDMPEFPGGMKALMTFLAENIKYPAEAITQHIQGRVMVSFIVEKDGQISTIKVVRSVHPSLDQEAVRVVKLMPKWRPGMKDGKAVRARFNMPVTFKYQDEAPEKTEKAEKTEKPEQSK